MALFGYRHPWGSRSSYGKSYGTGYGRSYVPSYDYSPPEPDISNYAAEARFKYVENLIIRLHKDSLNRDVVYADFRATFDDWKDRIAAIKADVHSKVADYYAKLNFVERYGLGSRSWIHDKDIVALLQILQVRARAKAAAKLEKLEAEIDGVAAKIAKVESGGRYYREDVITLTATFDRLRISIEIENDRARKRQQTIDKIAEAPFKAAEKTFEFGSNVLGVVFAILMVLAVPFGIIMIILHLFGVVK